MLGCGGAVNGRFSQPLLCWGIGVSLFFGAITHCFFWRSGDGFEVLAVARNLADRGAFSDPFAAGPTGPTAHVAPLFPFLVAAFMKTGLPWGPMLLVLTIVLSAAAAGLMPWASEVLLARREPGILAGALLPLSVPQLPQHDGVLSQLLCLLTCCGIVRKWPWSPLLAGLLILSNPAAVILVAIFWLCYGEGRRLQILAGAALVCVPWILRDYRALGTLVPIRDNFGMEFFLSNNECARPEFTQNPESGCLPKLHPNNSVEQNARLRELGEVRYGRERSAEARAWIAANKLRFTSLTAARAWYYWFPPVSDGPWVYATWALTGLFFLGLAIRAFPAHGAVAWCVLAAWLPYVLIQSDLRYRSISMWMCALLAGAVMAKVRKGWAGRRTGLNQGPSGTALARLFGSENLHDV